MIDYQSELNAEQHRVVTEADGPALVLAGAGSGKTRTIVYRVAYLIEKGVDPKNILLLTFTNKAAKEMVGRVEGLLSGRDLKFPYSGTFHHFANLVLRKYAPVLGYRENYNILDEEDSQSLIKSCLKSVVKTKETKFPSAAILNNVWSYCKNSKKDFKNILAARCPKFYGLAGTLGQVMELYEKKKKDANVMDFDDLLIRLLSLLKNNEEICDKLSRQFTHILVDEYQDTNYLQAEIICYLGSCHKNILVVGDDAQSIYSFRAAEIRNILDFPEVFPQTKIFKLETNYRSTPEILQVANETISNNFDQYPKNLKPVSPMNRGEPTGGSCDKPFLAPAATPGLEASFVADEILRLVDEGAGPQEIAVLFRAAHQSEMLEMELRKRGISYEYRGGLRFFERAHIKDAIAFLKVVNNFCDEPSWIRVLNLQDGIGDETAAKIFQEILNLQNLENIFSPSIPGLPSRASYGWKALIAILKNLKDKKPSAAISALIESDYGDYLISQYPNANERIDDLKVMAEFAAQYDNLNDFLSEVSLQEGFSSERIIGKSEDDGKIILSTIHQAKGLEWDSVFVIGLNEKNFPHYRALYENGGLEEERRLFYVAITRARKNLYFTYATKGGFDNPYPQQPSRFLSEIPEQLMERLTLDDELPAIELE